MKKLLPILLIASAFTACQSGPKKDIEVKKDFVLVDTTKIYPGNASSDTGLITRNVVVAPPVAAVPPPVINKRPVQRTTTTTKRPVVKSTSPVNNSTNLPTPTGTNTTTTGTKKADTVATAAPVAKKKEGWSDAAKGATIGGVGGAAAGAVIGRNGKGAVIGGIIGAAGGYILGRKKDKQSGRVDTIKH